MLLYNIFLYYYQLNKTINSPMMHRNPQYSYQISQISEANHCDHSYVTQTKNHPKALSMISTRKSSNDSIDTRTKFKTEICKYWLMKIVCPFQQVCCFAHGQEQIRIKPTLPSKYKTRRCTKFDQTGYCSYGARCQFIHHHIRQTIKYGDIIQKIRNGYSQFFEEIQHDICKKRRRLSVFETIANEEQDYGSKLDEKKPIEYEASDLCKTPSKIRHNSM